MATNPAIEAALPALLDQYNRNRARPRSDSGKAGHHDSLSGGPCAEAATVPSGQPHLELPAALSNTSKFSSYFPWIDKDLPEDKRGDSRRLSPRPVSILSPPGSAKEQPGQAFVGPRAARKPLSAVPNIPKASTAGWGAPSPHLSPSPRPSSSSHLEQTPGTYQSPLRRAGAVLAPLAGLSGNAASAPFSPAPSSGSNTWSDYAGNPGISPSRASSTLSARGQDRDSLDKNGPDQADAHKPPPDGPSDEIQSHAPSSTKQGPRASRRRPSTAVATQRFHIFDDSDLPGYEIKQASFRPSNSPVCGCEHEGDEAMSDDSILVRIPRQVCGWKAVLMHARKRSSSYREEAQPDGMDKRKSKVVGLTAFEARQEALKSHVDFRSGSGIVATMHTSHRIRKQEWDLSLVDGKRLTWKMTERQLALYLVPDQLQVAVFHKAPRTPGGQQNKVGSLDISLPDGLRSRRNSLYGPLPYAEEMPIEPNLVLASLIAIFAARGGHSRVRADYESGYATAKRPGSVEGQRSIDDDSLPDLASARLAREEAEAILSSPTDDAIQRPASATQREGGPSSSDDAAHKDGHPHRRTWLSRNRYTLSTIASDDATADGVGPAALTPAQRLASAYKRDLEAALGDM